jgi:hypothetical protein
MMTRNLVKLLLLGGALTIVTTDLALADCESDLVQLEQAYKTPALTAASKGALDTAKTGAVAALKKDDDATCHTAVADGIAKAGLKMK